MEWYALYVLVWHVCCDKVAWWESGADLLLPIFKSPINTLLSADFGLHVSACFFRWLNINYWRIWTNHFLLHVKIFGFYLSPSAVINRNTIHSPVTPKQLLRHLKYIFLRFQLESLERKLSLQSQGWLSNWPSKRKTAETQNWSEEIEPEGFGVNKFVKDIK